MPYCTVDRLLVFMVATSEKMLLFELCESTVAVLVDQNQWYVFGDSLQLKRWRKIFKSYFIYGYHFSLSTYMFARNRMSSLYLKVFLQVVQGWVGGNHGVPFSTFYLHDKSASYIKWRVTGPRSASELFGLVDV